MRKTIYILVVLSLIGNLAVAQQIDNVKSIDRIMAAMNKKDAATLLGMMADSATIGNLPKLNNPVAVPEILAKFPSMKSFQIVDQQMLADGDERIQLQVTYSDGKPGRPTFLFNRAGKIINLGIITGNIKGEPDKALADALGNAEQPETLVIPFKMVNGLVYLESMLNGIKGYFQFDSGAPVVILRKEFVVPEQIRQDVSVDFAGIGGQMQQVVWSTGNNLQVAGIVLHNLDAPVSQMDDMHLEIGDGSPILGLLGIGVLKNYQFTIDYRRQELLLEKMDDRGEVPGEPIDKGVLLAQYPLRLKRHIPIVDITFGGKVYPMGIDCGANANVLKKALETELKSYIDYEEGEVDIKGVNGTSQGNRIAFLTHARLGELPLQNMYTVITDQVIGSGTGHDALPIAGLLGTPFLNQYKMTLNFQKHTISFY